MCDVDRLKLDPLQRTDRTFLLASPFYLYWSLVQIDVEKDGSRCPAVVYDVLSLLIF